MRPALEHGDHALVDPRAYEGRAPAVGDIVWARHPIQSDITIVKRVASVAEDGRIELRSDNRDPAFATDSRTFGRIRPEHLKGRVTGRLA